MVNLLSSSAVQQIELVYILYYYIPVQQYFRSVYTHAVHVHAVHVHAVVYILIKIIILICMHRDNSNNYYSQY